MFHVKAVIRVLVSKNLLVRTFSLLEWTLLPRLLATSSVEKTGTTSGSWKRLTSRMLMKHVLK
jgi:hypothetical protein